MNKSIDRKRKGSYTVEAAVFLPVFLVAVLTLGYLMKVIAGVEGGMHSCCDEARSRAAAAYTDKSGLGFKAMIEKRIIEENRYISRADVGNMRYLGADGSISFDVAYHIDFHLPLKFNDGFDVNDRLKCRGWIGKTENDPFGFDRMEQDEDASTVYIFPSWGNRYHKKSCTFVTAHPVQTILTDHIRSHFTACRLCKAGDLPDGSVVYCFPQYGDAYHRENCSAVKKYTVTIELEMAKQRGYQPCSKCGGI